MQGFVFRGAREADAPELTRLAVAAKRSWGHSADLIDLWLPDLEFTPESIRANRVTLALQGRQAVGVVSVSCCGTSAELEGLWVHPACFGQGLGKALFGKAVADAGAQGATSLLIASDPHAEGFYLRLGALPAGTLPSTPAGRMLPRLVFRIGGCTPP
jgi:N-acetylglutamate synthase-like GNAT family acetyltransferase